MNKILYLPLDERPCNYDFPGLIIEGSLKSSVVRPPITVMGSKKSPADIEAVCDFLLKECADADYLVLALDTLLYGGIIPSRLHHLERDELLRRLVIIKKLKEKNPRLYISAFSLVMRCPCYSDSSEEPDYYAKCGREIFLYGQNEHKRRLGEITECEYESERERLTACLGFIDDYERRRAVNLDLLTEAITMVGKYIDEFTILQDDSNARGYTAMDREHVLRVASQRGIDLDTYPGADEAGMTLLARAATHLADKSPSIYVAFPNERACLTVPVYEDREICRTISAQIKSAGAKECYTEDEADIVLYCNLNDCCTYDVYFNDVTQADEGYIPEFVVEISEALSRGKGVAVADIAYCNAGDMTFVSELERKGVTFDLWGYAGWNTASNTVGTVICQAVIRYLYGDTEAHRRFLAHRLMDDAIYSAGVRRGMMYDFGANIDEAVSRDVCDRIVERINTLTSDILPSVSSKYEALACSLPWNRLFEIRLRIEEMCNEA